MNKDLKSVRDDAMTITLCLSPLAMFAAQAESLATNAVLISVSPTADDFMKDYGPRTAAGAAEALRVARENINTAMNVLGDYFNGGDMCSPLTEAATTPAFEALEKRSKGEPLDGD